jgi:hypothetical protein
MRLRGTLSEEEVFRAAFRRSWERRFDQAAPLWAVELAGAFARGELEVRGEPRWAALRNVAGMVERIKDG